MGYDVSFGGIDLPAFSQDFSEVVGGEYELVGAVPLPGPPRPLSMYTITLLVYGEPTETDPSAAGIDKRAQVKALLQDPVQRFTGIDFANYPDPDLDGFLVVGTATVGYAEGGVTFGDFRVSIDGAVLIPAEITLMAHRLQVSDRRPVGAVLDPRMRAVRKETVKGAKASPKHYLPLGAHDIVGQASPRLPDLHTYRTIFGEAPYVTDRTHGELITFEAPFRELGKGGVRAFDRRGHNDVKFTGDGDLEPELYGWVRLFGPLQPFPRGNVPVLDNGRCRVRYIGDGKFAVDTVKGGRYEYGPTIKTGYPEIVSARLKEISPERAVMQCVGRGKNTRAEIDVTLQRGWEGPQLDVYHQGDRHGKLVVDGDAHLEQDGAWSHARLASRSEALYRTTAVRQLLLR